MLWNWKECVCTQTHTYLHYSRKVHYRAHNSPLLSPATRFFTSQHPTSPKRSLFSLRAFKTKCFRCCVPCNRANCTVQSLYRSTTAKVGGSTAAAHNGTPTPIRWRNAVTFTLRGTVEHINRQAGRRPDWSNTNWLKCESCNFAACVVTVRLQTL